MTFSHVFIFVNYGIGVLTVKSDLHKQLKFSGLSISNM